MNKRVIAAIASVVLAVFGVVFLLNYASAANERAFAGTKLQTVLQVKSPVVKNTPAEKLETLVKAVRVPASAVAKGAVDDLATLSGMVATVDLEPGEQVLLARFGKADALNKKVKPAVPNGMQEVAISVNMPREVAGRIKAQDRIGILATAKFDDRTITDFILEQVLVLHADRAATEGATSSATTVLTLALKSKDVKKVVSAAESMSIWLTKQNKETQKDGSSAFDVKDVIR